MIERTSGQKAERRGQAALEFITTYGWAFVIILTGIAALSYFGVLKPPIADRCMVGPEFACMDYRLLILNNRATAEMIIANGKDFNMKLWNVSCVFPNGSKSVSGIDPPESGGSTSFKMDNTQSNTRWEPGEKRRLVCNTMTDNNRGGFVIGDKAKVRYTLTYVNEDVEGFNHTIDGELITEVVSG